MPQSFNSTSFLFGDKSVTTSIFEKTTPNAPLFGSKPIFGNISIDSTKSEDTKSTGLFGVSTSFKSSTPSLGAFSTANLSATTELPESQNTIPPSSLFSKTDDNKSKSEGLFNFGSKTDSPFKFGGFYNDSTKTIFGQNPFGSKDISVNEDSSKGMNIIFN